jgi:hypothetical protein
MRQTYGYEEHEKPVGALTYEQQASSFNMRLMHLKTLVESHIEAAKKRGHGPKTQSKCLRQVRDLLDFTERL